MVEMRMKMLYMDQELDCKPAQDFPCFYILQFLCFWTNSLICSCVFLVPCAGCTLLFDRGVPEDGEGGGGEGAAGYNEGEGLCAECGILLKENASNGGLIGVEQVVMKHTRFNSGGAHQGETSAPLSNFGMARSSSWFDMNSGNFSMAFRTPPVRAHQHDCLTGLRRVCSMEFRPHLMNSPEGVANPLLSSPAAPSNAELSILPQSTIYNWSCGHFSRPLLTGSDDKDTNARREQRERIALDCIAKYQGS